MTAKRDVRRRVVSMMDKPYYELHITMSCGDSNERNNVALQAEAIGWKFSAIDGDPNLGPGIKLYATAHRNGRTPVDVVREDLEDAANKLGEAGISVIRRKIEMVLFDSLRLES